VHEPGCSARRWSRSGRPVAARLYESVRAGRHGRWPARPTLRHRRH